MMVRDFVHWCSKKKQVVRLHRVDDKIDILPEDPPLAYLRYYRTRALPRTSRSLTPTVTPNYDAAGSSLSCVSRSGLSLSLSRILMSRQQQKSVGQLACSWPPKRPVLRTLVSWVLWSLSRSQKQQHFCFTLVQNNFFWSASFHSQKKWCSWI